MGKFRNYLDVLRVAKHMIQQDTFSDKDIIPLANVLCEYVLNDEHPQTAAGNVVDTFVDCLNTEEIRIKCNHDEAKSNKMAERYVLLLNTMCKQFKFEFPVSLKTMEFVELHNIYEPQPEAPEQANNSSCNELNLPDVVNTLKAQKTFARAIEIGWMKVRPEGGYEWIGFGTNGQKAKLSYLCARIYGYQYSAINGNLGDKVPYEALERLFNVTRLDRAMQQTFEAKKPQLWRKQIDQITTE